MPKPTRAQLRDRAKELGLRTDGTKAVLEERIAGAAAEALEVSKRAAQRAAVVRLLRQGRSRSVAADAVGVHRTTVARWAEAEPEFGMQVRQAEAEFIGACTDGILKAGLASPQNWPALMTLLERRFPEQFGQRARLDVVIEEREVARRIAAETGASEDRIHEEIEEFLRQHLTEAAAE